MSQYPQSRRRRCPEGRGVALIAVLWLLALLTVLATTAANLSVNQRRSMRTLANATQLEAIADSAIRVTLLQLAVPARGAVPIPLGQARSVRVLDTNVEVLIEREASRLDLNTADEEVLPAFLVARGWEESDARAIANRILDWRDADDIPREGGAEHDEYRAAELGHAPRNGPFESVEEVRQVLGAEHFEQTLTDAMTVYTHAREPVTIPDFPTGAPRMLAGEGLRARACVAAQNGGVCRVAIVRITGSDRNPFQTFVWRSGEVEP